MVLAGSTSGISTSSKPASQCGMGPRTRNAQVTLRTGVLVWGKSRAVQAACRSPLDFYLVNCTHRTQMPRPVLVQTALVPEVGERTLMLRKRSQSVGSDDSRDRSGWRCYSMARRYVGETLAPVSLTYCEQMKANSTWCCSLPESGTCLTLQHRTSQANATALRVSPGANGRRYSAEARPIHSSGSSR